MKIQVSKSNIQVFPISIQRTSRPGDRVLSETNLSSVFRSFTDKKSYVISKDFSSSADFEFMIHGYFCRIESTDIPDCFTEIPNGNPIYAAIHLSAQDNEDYPILEGSEDDTYFTGVEFSSQLTEFADTPYKLHILNKSNEGAYTVPPSSKIKMDLTSIDLTQFNLTELDGGIV